MNDYIPSDEQDVVTAPGALPAVFAKYPTLRQVIEETDPQGEKTDITQWFGKPVLIRAVKLFTGQYGEGAYIVFADSDGVIWNLVTGGAVVVERLKKVAAKLPVVAIFYEVEGGSFGRYYTIE